MALSTALEGARDQITSRGTAAGARLRVPTSHVIVAGTGKSTIEGVQMARHCGGSTTEGPQITRDRGGNTESARIDRDCCGSTTANAQIARHCCGSTTGLWRKHH